jgi:hypothetical protein
MVESDKLGMESANLNSAQLTCKNFIWYLINMYCGVPLAGNNQFKRTKHMKKFFKILPTKKGEESKHDSRRDNLQKISRRKAFKGVCHAAGSIFAISGGASFTASAHDVVKRYDNECDPSYTLILEDTDNDASVYIDPHDATRTHYVDATVVADVAEDPEPCTLGERITEKVYQERIDCDTYDAYWSHLLTSTAECTRTSGNGCRDTTTKNTEVDTEGSGWFASGKYKVKVIPCFKYDTEECHGDYNTWNCPSDTSDCSKLVDEITADENLGSCEDGVQFT